MEYHPAPPFVCAVADELLSAGSPAAFQRQIERLELESDAVLDIVDATGEGWAFHAELMVVSLLTSLVLAITLTPALDVKL
jgi:hypothetical protein